MPKACNPLHKEIFMSNGMSIPKNYCDPDLACCPEYLETVPNDNEVTTSNAVTAESAVCSEKGGFVSGDYYTHSTIPKAPDGRSARLPALAEIVLGILGGPAGCTPVSSSTGEADASKTNDMLAVPGNSSPVITISGNTTASEGQIMSFTVWVHDQDDDSITLTVYGIPPGALFYPENGRFSWTPDYNDAGEYTLAVVANDGQVDTIKEIQLRVISANGAPRFEEVGPQRVREGDLLSFTLLATDPDGDPVEISAADLPEGASFDPASRTFEWTPGFDQAGSHEAVFIASDGKTQITKTVGITVDNYSRVTVSPLSDLFPINEYTTSYQERPRIAVSSSGNFVAGWDSAQQDGDCWGVVGRFFGPLGTPETSEVQPQNNPYANQMNVSVARNPSGLTAMTWSSGSYSCAVLGTPDYSVMLQILAPDGTPVGSNQSVSDWTGSNPDVAVSEESHTFVVWANGWEDTGWEIDGRIYDETGNPVTGIFKISETSATYNVHPRVVAQPDGNFLVAWMSEYFTGPDAPDDYVRVRRYNASGVPMSEEIDAIEGDLNGTYNYTKLDVDASGNGVVTAANLLRRLGPDGIPVGDQVEFSPDSFGGADAMAVAPEGNFVMIGDSILSVHDSGGELLDDPIPIDIGGTYVSDAQLIEGGLLYVVSTSAYPEEEIYGRVFHVEVGE